MTPKVGTLSEMKETMHLKATPNIELSATNLKK